MQGKANEREIGPPNLAAKTILTTVTFPPHDCSLRNVFHEVEVEFEMVKKNSQVILGLPHNDQQEKNERERILSLNTLTK